MIFDQIFRLHVPGEWQDVWLYKDSVLLWDRYGATYRILIDRLQADINKSVGADFGPLFELALFRNDWKSSKQLNQIMTITAVQKALQQSLEQSFHGGPAVVKLAPDLVELPIEPPAGIILDTDIYGNRVYIASTSGTFETRFNPSFAGEPAATEQILTARTSSVNAKYMALNVSAGDEGLWFKPISFGATAEFELMRDLSDDFKLEQVEDRSTSTDFAHRNLLNYEGTSAAPQLLRTRGRTDRSHDGARYDEYMVEGYEQPERLEELAQRAMRSTQLTLRGREQLEEYSTDLKVLGNSNFRLLVAADGVVRVLDLAAFRGSETEVKPDRRFGRASIDINSDEVLSTQPLSSSFLVESFDEVSMVAPEGIFRLFQGEVARVRTFQDSLRFREVTALVTEDSIELVGFL